MPAPPLNEAARQDYVEKMHVPRSHPKADEATRLLCDLLEVCQACSNEHLPLLMPTSSSNIQVSASVCNPFGAIQYGMLTKLSSISEYAVCQKRQAMPLLLANFPQTHISDWKVSHRRLQMTMKKPVVTSLNTQSYMVLHLHTLIRVSHMSDVFYNALQQVGHKDTHMPQLPYSNILCAAKLAVSSGEQARIAAAS